MERSKYPEKYWHCRVSSASVTSNGRSVEKIAVINDLSITQIYERVVIPWISNQRFTVADLVVASREMVGEVKIIHTVRNAHYYYDQAQGEQRRCLIGMAGFGLKYAPFSEDEHTDYTYDFLLAPLDEIGTLLDTRHDMTERTSMDRLSVRKMLNHVLKTSSEFDAFCLDHFPVVYRKFTNGMDSVARMNMLLLEDLELICSLLRMRYSAEVHQYESELAQDSS